MSLGAFGDEGDIADENEPRTGGPEKCPRPCSECANGAHHFSDATIELAGGSGEEGEGGVLLPHPAEAAGCEAWYQCKHCPAWREYTDDDIDGEEEPAA